MTPFAAFALVLSIVQAPQPRASLTIEEAVKTALANSPKMRAARFAAEADRAQIDRDRPVARPSVNAST